MHKYKTAKILLYLLIILFIFSVLPINTFAASQTGNRRIINVVYDDSGSMYDTYNKLVDTWCQAKYSMEAFAALLNETDKMNIYYMSDYSNGTSARPRIVLDGKNSADENVAKIHNQKTVAANTPFNSVKKAYTDLNKASADEKWLVVLTDGEFQGINGKKEIDKYFSQKSDDVKVIFLAMGADADGITEKQSRNIFYVKASTSKQILNSITDISTRIFNSNKLEINASSKAFSFDVPMGELVVFAQGANVKLNGVKKENGTLIQSSGTPVEVKYSKCDATNYSNLPAKDLLGKIASFKDDFTAGNYTIDVSGAETIEIYYKPNIEVTAYLVNSKGNSVSDLSKLAAGEYTISFGFVKSGSLEKVANSKLLGDVSYQAIVTNDGTTPEKIYADGDKISLKEGSLSIDVIANYLDYNSVSTNLVYDIYKDKDITFEIIEDPTYNIDSNGFKEDVAIKIASKIEGQNPTEEQWAVMELPKVKLVEGSKKLDLNISKTKEVGVFELKPSFPDVKPSTGTYENTEYIISYQQKINSAVWQGSAKGTVKLQDLRLWWERNRDLLIKLTILSLILFILIGYLPFIKNYLPKSLKKKPYIQCVPSEPGEKKKDRNGIVEKNLISTIVPYASQTATIKYVPKGVTGCPAMTVRAIKRRRMILTNIKVFCDKEHITFDGETIRKDRKKFETGAGVSIRAKRGEWTYICSPNQIK